MRTIVDLPPEQIQALKGMSRAAGISRAELIRRAVAEFLVRHRVEDADEAFGLWRGRGEDGLDYQERLRSEWEA